MVDQTPSNGIKHPNTDSASGSIHSLNEAVRQELWYLDTVVATPFRAVRRSLGSKSSPWMQSLDEMVWAVEGMARLPVKFIQSAFGENLNQSKPPKG